MSRRFMKDRRASKMEGMFNKMADYKVQNGERWIWYNLAISNVRIQQYLHCRDVTTVA